MGDVARARAQSSPKVSVRRSRRASGRMADVVADEIRRLATGLGGRDGESAPDAALRVHLLSGLPTGAVRRGFRQAGEGMPVVPLDALGDAAAARSKRVGILLPPFVEPSLLLQGWEECDFLSSRFDGPAHVAGVATFVDVDEAAGQLASKDSLARRGWGRNDRDGRSVAEAAVEQIESATHLVLVGGGGLSDPLSRLLDLLNPHACRIAVGGGPTLDVSALSVTPDGGRSRGRHQTQPAAHGVRVVPPWMEALEQERDPATRPGLLVYRRAHPFDPKRFRDWLASPPRNLVRGKGHVWLAGEPDHSFLYSCAGPVHRLSPGNRWWASCGEGAWPTCATHRRRLLDRWHPRFGDRCQELVFAATDLDRARLCADLDACLVPDHAIDEALRPSTLQGPTTRPMPRARLH